MIGNLGGGVGLVLGIGLGVVIFHTIKRKRLASPAIWTGLAGGLVVGLTLALFADEGYVRETALTLGIIFGTLGAAIGYFSDMLIQDGKARA